MEERVGSLRHFRREHEKMKLLERVCHLAEDGLCTYHGKESNRGSILLVGGCHGLVFGSLHGMLGSNIDDRNNHSN